jgi:hypothetical protein
MNSLKRISRLSLKPPQHLPCSFMLAEPLDLALVVDRQSAQETRDCISDFENLRIR